jgi:hypothetical protein
MKKNSHLFYRLCFPLVGWIIMTSYGCDKNDSQGKPGPERLEGSLMGRVEMKDEYNETLYGLLDSVKVMLVDSANPAVAYTNQDGKYIIDNLYTGNITLKFSKEGFGNKQVNGSFLGGNVPELFSLVTLFQHSSTTFPVFNLIIDNGLIYATGEMSPEPTSFFPRYGLVLISTSPDISPENYEIFSFIWGIAENPFTFYLDFYSSPLPPSGTTIYARAYGLRQDYYQDEYFDEDLGLAIFNLNPNSSELVSITIP